ncbi:hypothetical protein EN844_32005, partial [Mesorhizobium sp. M3A.F.Ca.ET.201.01.1.1]
MTMARPLMVEARLPPQKDGLGLFSLGRSFAGLTLPLVGRVGAQRRGGGSAGFGGIGTACIVGALTPTRVASRRDLPHRLFAKLLDGKQVRYLPFFANRALRLLPLLFAV